jgi:uncharacterized protein involved in exopolysaccharide biosynthesis
MDNRLKMTRTHPETGDGLRSRGSSAGDPRYAIDLPAMAGLLLAKRRWIFGIVGTVTVLALVSLMLTPNRYTSRAIILPSGQTGGNLSTLKAMVGLSAGMSTSDENSSALFPLILSSNLVRDAVLSKEYHFSFKSEPMNVTLKDYIGIDDPDRLRRALAGVTSIRNDSRTGEIILAVETTYPELSQAVVQEYLTQLESYNLHKRKSSATENARYLERQVQEAKLALEDAENALETYRSRNAAWVESTSPEILTQTGRLTREVQLRSTAYLLLDEQFELAKLQAQKDIPIVSVLDSPSLPTLKSGPFRAFTLLSVMAISFVLVIFGIVTLDLLKQIARGSAGSSLESLSGEVTAAFPRTTRLYDVLRKRSRQSAVKVDA